MRGRAVDLVIAFVLYIPHSSTFGTGRLDRVPYVYRWVPSLQYHGLGLNSFPEGLSFDISTRLLLLSAESGGQPKFNQLPTAP